MLFSPCRRLQLTLLVLVLLTGCASRHRQMVHFPDQHVAIEDPQKGRIYVIRQPTFWRFNLVSLARKIRVTEGDREIGSIAGQRGFLSWETEPGHKMLFVPDEAFLELTVEKGNAYYILVRDKAVGVVGPGTGRMTVELKLVDEEKGRKELAKSTPPPVP